MGFKDWSTSKKIAIVLFFIITICCVIGLISFVNMANSLIADSKNITVNIGENSNGVVILVVI